MKKVLFILVFFSFYSLYAQNSIKELVNQGIKLHDAKNYKKAIDTYKKALEIDSKSTLVHYEIAFSYFKNKEFKKAIKHCDLVLKQKAQHMLTSYIIKGSSLDVLGKTKQSIKLFEKAIKETKGHYLLYYNLALNYYKIKQYDNAEINTIKAIELNSNHASSHLMLANINDKKGNKIQSLLANHYFLFLEPNSSRSKDAYAMMMKNFGGNVSKDKNKPNTINILLSPNKDDQFSAAELMISMLEASKNLKENKDKTEDELFIENTKSFFTVLGELRKKKNKEIWWTFYTNFFYELAKSKHLEAYCKIITQSNNDNSKKWLMVNQQKLDNFGDWLKTQN